MKEVTFRYTKKPAELRPSVGRVGKDWLSAFLTIQALEGHQLKLVGAKFKTIKRRAAGMPRQRTLQMIQVFVASREGWT